MYVVSFSFLIPIDHTPQLDPNAIFLVRQGQIVTKQIDGVQVLVKQTDAMLWVQGIACVLSIVIGMATFTGSMVAVLKLHGTLASRPRIIPMRKISNLIMVAGLIVFGALTFVEGWNDRELGLVYLCLVGFIASAYGFFAVMAIGGGDMPVSISFLNSLSGFSTSAAGFMLSNKALVVAGAFVGCSGIILTLVMCNAMNRSVAHVLIGGFGEGSASASKPKAEGAEDEDQGVVQEMSAEDVVEKLTSSKSVIVVPGYGMVSLDDCGRRTAICSIVCICVLARFTCNLLIPPYLLFFLMHRPSPRRSIPSRNSRRAFDRVVSWSASLFTPWRDACRDT